jgi:hypothetical protein
VKGVIAKTVNRWEIELLAAKLAFIRLEHDRFGSQVVDLILKFHYVLQVAVNRFLVFFDLALFAFHSF